MCVKLDFLLSKDTGVNKILMRIFAPKKEVVRGGNGHQQEGGGVSQASPHPRLKNHKSK
jgi:hypothetical protein